jgi:2-keto-4-pentenoate hydratase/2-oxohepta-3-ene-1,7-dioic acid hydratase in catechol pathway
MWAPKVAEAADASAVNLGQTSRFSDLRLLAPIEPGARIFGTGINYPTHLKDGGDPDFKPPPTMAGYVKLDSTVVDPGGVICYPATTNQLDYEIEIVMVMAKPVLSGVLRTSSLLGYTDRQRRQSSRRRAAHRWRRPLLDEGPGPDGTDRTLDHDAP